MVGDHGDDGRNFSKGDAVAERVIQDGTHGAAPCEALPGGAAKSKCGLDVAAMHEARNTLLSMTSIVSAMLSEKFGESGDRSAGD